MQVKNNHELSPVQLHAYVNRGEVIKYPCPHTGKQLERAAKPNLKLIHIPALATVEIEDELWLAATMGSTTVKIFEEAIEQIKGVDLGKDSNGNQMVATTSVLHDTGKRKKVNLVQQMIEDGRITIIKPVANNLTKEEMQAKLKEHGVPTNVDAELSEVEALYNKVCL